MSLNPAGPPSGRVDAVDFWRGIVLVAILCDHIPGNLIEKATPRNFALSDSAEAFVFLSGVSVALAHYRRAQRADWRDLIRRCCARAFGIYGVHISLTALAIAVFGLAYAICGAPNLLEEHGRTFLFHQPLQGALGVLMLTQQIGYFNILPMYVVLLLASPAILALTRVSPYLALGASLVLYVTVREFGWALPNWPESGTWFFNPLAWQLVFTLGILSGVVWRDRPIPYFAPLYAAGIAGLLASAFTVTDGFGFEPGLRDSLFAGLDLPKSNLGLARLIHFIILAYVASQTSISAAQHNSVGQELQRLGRHSLAIFALGSVLSCVGQAVIQIASTDSSPSAPAVGLIYTLISIFGLFLFARHLERRELGIPWQAHFTERSKAALQPAFLRASHSLSHWLHPSRR